MVSLLAREKVYVNEVVLGTVFGIFMGPYFAGIFDPRDWGTHSETITLEIMRIVLATGLFAIGVELPKSYMARHAKSLLAMVVPTMAIGWVIVAGLIRALFPSLSFISCLGISACLTPTDPIICAAIVGGKFARKHVPLNLRQILSAESAANDGLAYPFLTLAIYLTVDKTEEQAISHWFVIGWLYQVFLGVFIGALAGLAFSSFMKLSHRRGYVDRQSYVAQYLAFAVFITGLVSTLGSDDLLAAFAAGSAISWDGDFNVHTEGESFAHVIDLVLNCGCFMYIGAWLPFKEFTFPELGITPLRLFALAVGIIALRRIPAILMLYKFIPEISSFKEALFCGHFGPMGVGAVFISTLAMHKLPDPRFPLETQQDYLAASLEPIVAFVVLASIIIHGLSIPFFNISRNVSRTVSLQVTATTASGRRPAPEWLLRVNRFTTRETPNSASPIEKTTSEEIDVEGKAGIGEASNRDVTSRDFAVMSPVSPSPQTYATPDNGSIVESELYHRGSGSSPRNASGSVSPATINAVSVVDVQQSDKEGDLSSEAAAPQKSVRFPEPRE
ncbi:Sodium/hydrogen exchanger family-domain-containing protein [Coprinopsis sp. MPI-PUGE-AT-0042]|nr:Sodium/hydrogen exchanger family-domain-containing protein [Coprinopsis sp. MPI-PUGE-AT-0042]